MNKSQRRHIWKTNVAQADQCHVTVNYFSSHLRSLQPLAASATDRRYTSKRPAHTEPRGSRAPGMCVKQTPPGGAAVEVGQVHVEWAAFQVWDRFAG